MRRIAALVVCLLSAPGCGGLGWYQGAGDIPGVAASDYAFYNFCGTVTQRYQFSPPQVESSAIEALGDLGFAISERPVHLPTGESTIHAKTPDGRPTTVEIIPQNSLTSVRVTIGPVHVGDFDLSNQILRRIALNFGTLMRAYTPIDPTLPKRSGGSSRFVADRVRRPPEQLEGDGLRPNENRDKKAADEAAPAAQDATNPALTLPGLLQSLAPNGAAVAPGPNLPFVPFPVPTDQ